jgi:hypothetical protein
MEQVFVNNPWLVFCALIAAVIVTCVAIVCITDHLRKSRQADIDAGLKQDMLNRGMSAADIKTVLEACGDGQALRMALEQCDQPVRVGLGKFQVEVGATHTPTPKTAEAPAS